MTLLVVYQTLREAITIVINSSKKIEDKGKLLNLLYEASITLINNRHHHKTIDQQVL